MRPRSSSRRPTCGDGARTLAASSAAVLATATVSAAGRPLCQGHSSAHLRVHLLPDLILHRQSARATGESRTSCCGLAVTSGAQLGPGSAQRRGAVALTAHRAGLSASDASCSVLQPI